MMLAVQNIPLYVIMLFLSGGVICCALTPRWAKWYTLLLHLAVTMMLLSLLGFVLQSGDSYVYCMGHVGAPWGNELRVGTLEALMAVAFTGVCMLSLLGGMGHIFHDCERGKAGRYFAVVNLLMSSMMALLFTNDLFTAYVFIEINTIASCALVMVRSTTGKTLASTAQYLIMSLLGSGLFLIALGMLYALTGHLLMENIASSVSLLFASGSYMVPLTVIIGLFTISLAIKSALFPFHTWLPDAHGCATAASSAILSGIVIKGYILLLIKLICRVITPPVVAESMVLNAVFVLGAAAMIIGSLEAMREKNLKRMLAFSSVSQVGYIFLAIGLGSKAGFAAACVQMLAHAFTKPMLFIAAGGLMDVSGGSRQMEALRGAAWRDRVGGISFLLGSLSMIGIPLTSGFVAKLYLSTSAVEGGGYKSYISVIVIIISTLLNAMYYIPALGNLYSRGGMDDSLHKRLYRWDYCVASAAFVMLNLILGLFSDNFIGAIFSGLDMFGV